MKRTVALVLLFVMSFSIAHEYAFTYLDNEHCSINEYVEELSAPSAHHDICDTHFEYHQLFVLPQENILLEKPDLSLVAIISSESYTFETTLSVIKPPIV